MQQRASTTAGKTRRPAEGQDGSVFRKGLWHYPDTSGFGDYSCEKDYTPADLDVTALVSSIEAAHQPKTYPNRRTWYVDSESGSNSASAQTPGAAVKSIQTALDRADEGDLVSVAPGVYQESIRLAKNGITLSGKPGDVPILDGSNGLEVGITIPSGLSDVTIDRLEIQHFARAAVLYGYEGAGGRGANNRISNCRLHHAFEFGMSLRHADHWLIESNEIFRIGNHGESMGIKLAESDRSVIRNNRIYLVRKNAIRTAGQGASRTLVINNILYESNVPLSLNTSTGNVVLNNLIYSCQSGIVPKHLHTEGGWSVIWHNTIHDCSRANLDVAVNRRRVTNPADGPDLDQLDARNNIFSGSRGPCVQIRSNIMGEHFTLEGNLYHQPADRVGEHIFRERGSANVGSRGCATLSELRQKYYFEKTGVERDPGFVSAEDARFDPAEPDHLVSPTPLRSPFGSQVGARGLERSTPLYKRLPLRAVAASAEPELASLTVDGQRETYWVSKTATENQWIIWELETPATFQFAIYAPSGHQCGWNIRRYALDLSDDNKTWSEVARDQVDAAGSHVIIPVDPPQSARFVRLRMIDNHREREPAEGTELRLAEYALLQQLDV